MNVPSWTIVGLPTGVYPSVYVRLEYYLDIDLYGEGIFRQRHTSRNKPLLS